MAREAAQRPTWDPERERAAYAAALAGGLAELTRRLEAKREVCDFQTSPHDPASGHLHL